MCFINIINVLIYLVEQKFYSERSIVLCYGWSSLCLQYFKHLVDCLHLLHLITFNFDFIIILHFDTNQIVMHKIPHDFIYTISLLEVF